MDTPMGTIWFMGEALIDFVPTTPLHSASPHEQAFAPRAGGSPLNAAKAAVQAGANAGFLGAVSTDLFGERLIKDLQDHGVDISHTPRTDAPCTLAFVELNDGVPRYAFFNALSATALMDPDPKAFTPGNNDILSFGSISLIDRPGADNIAAFALAHAERTMIALDPNARQGMTPDLATWRARISALSSKAGVIRLSDEDLEVLAPGQSPADYAAERLSETAGLVVVTLGDKGALGFCRAGTITLAGQQSQIVDSVGAGDTLMGGVMAELMLRGLTTRAALDTLTCDTLGDILRYGVTAAAMNCESSGCAPPARARVLEQLARMTA